jgi:hypothetical protein
VNLPRVPNARKTGLAPLLLSAVKTFCFAKCSLLNDLIGGSQQRFRDAKAERSG